MRIWHEELIPQLCTRHLVAMWREGLGCASIIMNNKKGYRKHPAVLEFIEAPQVLLSRMLMVYLESKKRGYNFDKRKLRPLVDYVGYFIHLEPQYRQWQSLKEQKEVLRKKGCGCNI